MLTGPWPVRLDHKKAASQARKIKAQVPIDLLPRFSEILVDSDGDVDIELAFSSSHQGRTRIQGRAQLIVGLICQNCMQPFKQPINCEIDVKLACSNVESDTEVLDCRTDVIVCNDREISLTDLVEDELIMSLPMIPRHNNLNCVSNEYVWKNIEEDDGENETTHRPFAGLASEMIKKDVKER